MPVPKTDRIGPGKIPAERVVLVLLSGKKCTQSILVAKTVLSQSPVFQ